MTTASLTRAQQVLVTKHAYLVQKIARYVRPRAGPRVTFDDLISAGQLGLVESALVFDPYRGNDFHEFAEFRVRAAMLNAVGREFAHERRVRLVAEQAGYWIAAEQYRDGNVVREDDEQAATRLEDTLDLALGAMIVTAAGAVSRVSEAEDPSLRLEWAELHRAIATFLGECEERAREAIRMLYFEGRTYVVTAGQLGVSMGALRTVEQQVLRWLARRLASLGLIALPEVSKVG